MIAQNELDHYFQTLEKEHKFSGVVLITQGDLSLYAGAFGYASRAWGIPNNLATRFDTASITKLFTAVATLQLIDQQRLAFDTRVIDLLGLEGTAISNEVTVYQLLTHTSGIGDDAEEENNERYEDVWKSKPNYSIATTTDMLPQFVHKPANFPPGQGCRYCNCSYILLGLAIEKISGMSYRDYVRKHIFAPVGMTHSDFLRMDRVNEHMAEGSDPIFSTPSDDGTKTIIGWKRNIYAYPPIGSPDSGAYVTAGDLDHFLRAVQRGELLSPELTTAFFTPQAHWQSIDKWKTYFGYGLKFYLDPAGQMVCYQKEGVNAGVSGVIRHFPKADINLVILSNMEDGAWEPLRAIHKLITDGKFAGKSNVAVRNARINIRPVESADAAEWLRMRVALWPDDPAKEAAEIAHFLSTTPHSKLPLMHEAFVCPRPDGTLCGLVEVAIHTSAPGCKTDHIGYLEAWYVDPDARQQGTGRALARAVEDWARAQGCTEMESDTDPSYPLSPDAHAALGYTEVQRHFRKDLT
jgi:CubicO group peptidase (beta-lactamase class C family)/GNAT superfamily N-acetyltransferase